MRGFVGVAGYDRATRGLAVQACIEAARTCDDLADIVNAGIEELLRHRRELPAFGTLLKLARTARALVKGLDRRHVAFVNQRHVTEEILDDAITGAIDAYAQVGLHHYWGDGSSASADGMKWDVHQESLKSSYHIRYGGYGGIGYYLVSDTYIALFGSEGPLLRKRTLERSQPDWT